MISGKLSLRHKLDIESELIANRLLAGTSHHKKKGLVKMTRIHPRVFLRFFQ